MKKKLLYISLIILVLFFQPTFNQPPIDIQVPIVRFMVQFSFYLALATLSIVLVLMIPKRNIQPVVAIIAIPFFLIALFGIVASFVLSNEFYLDLHTYKHMQTNDKYIYQYLDQGGFGNEKRLVHVREIIEDKIRWFNHVDSLKLTKGKWQVFRGDSLVDSIIVE